MDRLDATRPAKPDVQGLRALQLAHLRAVPFENLSIHLGEVISLEPDALFDKVVGRRRGGFCYELNGLFAELLTALGYRVTLLAARVFNGATPGPLFDHLALRVDLDDGPWLVDVGFGDFSDGPLRLDGRAEQRDGGGVFQIGLAPGVPDGHGAPGTPDGHGGLGGHGGPGYFGDLDIAHDGDPAYRLTARPYELADFVPTCWWQATSPKSHFTRSPVCSMRTARGRTTLRGRKLIQTVDGERTERVLDETELLPAYLDHFGITLDRVPSAGGDTVRAGRR
ncbi:arylamine N-acetyltransferase family protein [Streptosporangium sp. NBC_01469]|uniref:arylamine N-acetyltransferase family protein n=1 Tax=Streptosporangium sp. NBC_01469 TaxID=2903898 RepID=UPI002E2BB3A9|nr:arylamine N-acetyltransferase [Streptosporangium sp. NBC_01469]